MLVDPLGPGLMPADQATQKYLEEVAVLVAKQIVGGQIKIDRTKKGMMDKIMAFALQYNWVKDKIFGKAREQVMKLSGGLYPAPLRVRNYLNNFVFNTKIHNFKRSYNYV